MTISRTAPLLLILGTMLACTRPAGQQATVAPSLTGPAAATAWEFQNPGSWTVDNGVLQLVTAGRPSGPIRRPAEWAILRDASFDDVTIDVEARADAPASLMGRDVIVFFGYQSPTRFYYAHLSNETTPPHNGIFLVNDADRLRIDDSSGIPRLTDNAWHHVRVDRDAKSGSIRVYLDDMDTPVLQASDTTLRSGRVGFGSFDDPAAFRNVRITGDR